MRHNALLALCGLLLISAAQAEPLIAPKQPIVVYEGKSTVSTWPYFQRIQPDRESRSISMPEGSNQLSLADRLPLENNLLSVGQPQMKTIPGLITPLFVMGMDRVSLTWFQQAADGLVDIGARGIVVQASNKADWLDLQDRARDVGIDLMLLEGDSLAQGYGITTYPVVLLDPKMAGEGADE
jgi:integrating conjugative element protein (TIGR03765 family)